MNLDKMEFKYCNFLDADLSDATHIYLYGSALTEEAAYNIVDYFKHLKPGTIIISVTFLPTDFSEDGIFELEQEFTAAFSWGKTPVYILLKL